MKRKSLHGAILGGLALAAGAGFPPLPPLPARRIKTDADKAAEKDAIRAAEAKRQRKNAKRRKP